MTQRIDDGTGEILVYPGYGLLHSAGTTVPVAGRVGFAPSCIFQDIDSGILYVNEGTNESCDFQPTTAFTQSAALTAQLTTITHTAPGADDFAVQDFTQTTPFGFVTANEANTVLKVVANLQARLAEVEAALETAGIVAAN